MKLKEIFANATKLEIILEFLSTVIFFVTVAAITYVAFIIFS